MTVVEVGGFEIACRWFEGAAVTEGTFSVHLLGKEVRPEAGEVIAYEYLAVADFRVHQAAE
jgi:hypothetical protein